jgi:hypothetical protein
MKTKEIRNKFRKQTIIPLEKMKDIIKSKMFENKIIITAVQKNKSSQFINRIGKSIVDFFQTKIDKYVLKRFVQLLPEKLITELYKKVVKNNLLIDIKYISVKKGKGRYVLLIIKDKDCKTVFNLGRHIDDPILEHRFPPINELNLIN